MNQHLQSILNFIEQDESLTAEEKNALSRSLKDADKELEITNFKLDRTEKVKRTTAILLEETIEELEQKRKAVEAQNRELEIESSLERVRTVAMGMMKADDLLNVCEIQFNELKLLGFDNLRNALINIFNDDNNYFLDYDFSDFSGGTIIKIPYSKNDVVDRSVEQMKSATDAFTEFIVEGKELEEWKVFRKQNGEYDDTRLKDSNALYYYFYSISGGGIGISAFKKISEEQLTILKRFRNVFELAYKRYVDITKAEAQAREAQIQLALERVRARTMAMQKSGELMETAVVLFDQLNKLGENIERTIIGVVNEEEHVVDAWATRPDGSQMTKMLKFPIDEPIVMQRVYAAWQQQKRSIVIDLRGEELESYFQFLKGRSSMLKRESFGERRVESFVFFSKGFLGVISADPNTAANVELYERFAAVFDQTYTRFLDLQKSEAQAKEAQIEASLERVRSRSMGMQKSEELKEVIQVVYEQFVHLNINTEHTGFVMDYKQRDDRLIWVASKYGVPSQLTIPYFDCEYYNRFNEAKEKGWDFFATNLSFEDKNSFYRELFKYIPELPNEAKEFYFSCPGLAISTVLLENVGLYIENFEGIPYSDEDNATLMRFGKVFQQTYTRFLDLKKAEAQAREAQIEAALEKVRSRSLAMHHSVELEHVVVSLFDRLVELGLTLDGALLFIFEKEKRNIELWIATRQLSTPEKINLPYDEKIQKNGIYQDLWSAIEKGEHIYNRSYSSETKNDYFRYVAKYNPLTVPEFVTKIQIETDSWTANFVAEKNSLFGTDSWAGHTLTTEDFQTLTRFAKVFDQTYTRFLDLKKAEAQAREAQIEAALEKVRSRSLAMHKSDEIKDVVRTVVEKITDLNIEMNGGVSLVTFSPGSKDLLHWLWIPEQLDEVFKAYVPYFDHTVLRDCDEAREQGLELIAKVYSGEDKETYFNDLFHNTDFSAGPEDVKNWVMQQPYFGFSYAIQKHSGIFLNDYTGKFFSQETNDILIRFSKVFEQSYIRFLDLQKAEAQARESQIEAALERVRSKAMAMHKSEDLHTAVAVVFEELDKLNLGVLRCGISILDKETRTADIWVTSITDQGPAVQVSGGESFDIHPLLQGVFDAWLRQEEDFSYLLEADDLLQYYKAVKGANFPLPESQMDFSENEFKKQFAYGAIFHAGVLFAFRDAAFSHEAKKVMKRFAGVFDLTYKRFLDLQKAEAQAKEAQIEAALERVRSRTLAMQKSDELAETAAVLFQQLILLGIEPNRLYISIIKDEEANSEFWITDEDGSKVSAAFEANMNSNASLKKMLTGWKEKNRSLIIDMKGNELKEYFSYLSSIHVPFKDGLSQTRRIQYIAYFNKGFIGMASPDEQPEETTLLLERFAAVFNLTFTRFNDLQVAEAHALQAEQDLVAIKEAKQKAEEALAELQVTQKQLIQSEKMASLGELTAGIAHEIQNPLNFVNNFSEVSNELIDEMNAEIEKGDMAEAKAIANDIKQNLEKINHHGKRADAIVKGMLQHSRSSSATKEPTDINKLADEYLRLAYHGLRAKDKTFNATMKTDYDESVGNINVIPQDMGRVILNLITNAFYVVNEKKKQIGDGYEPTVTVSTSRSLSFGEGQGEVKISVKDNGNGIPQKVLDKIFQPFFTTKPTGQGTGLGLSLSYDIVKAHGGEIKVETKENVGTEFIIQLPTS